MVSQELNERLTRTGRGRPAGEVLRRYWQPAALVEELDGERPVVPVTLLGERLVLFRDNEGELGLIGRHCLHRGADLCFGRREDNGLRCPFHGWHYDRNGQCVEQPGEPEGSRMHERIRTTSYPVVEKNGIVFAYMGPDEPPGFPASTVSGRPRPTSSRSRVCGSATGCRRSRSASTPPMPPSCIASSRTKTRRTATAGSSATARPKPTCR